MYQFGGKSYKYRALFQSLARTVPPTDKDKQKLAIASLNNLNGIFDDKVRGIILKNPDLLAISSALILGNFANRNDDCVLLADLVEVADKFEYKFLDAEHNRSDIKGFIDEIGWALYPSNELIDEDGVLVSETPVQLAIGGYLWRVVDPDLCNLVEEAANPNSENYLAVSTSFELLFNDYWICISPDKNALNPNARFIKAGDDDFEKFDAKLRVNGGDGKEGGMLVFRVLKDEILPVGAGIVRAPASGIKGIATVSLFEPANANHPLAENLDLASVNELTPQEIDAKLKEINIILTQASVNENKSTNIIMVISSITDIEAQFEAFTKLPAKEATASIQKIMEAKILELSTEYAAKEKAKDEALASELKAKADLEARAANLGKAVEDLQAQLKEVADKQTAAANEAAFNSRMAALDEAFDLDDDDRAILVDEVKTLESEAAFAPWMDKKKKLMKEKTKEFKKEKAKAMEEKFAKAGVKFSLDEKTLDIKEVFASVKPDNEPAIPNGNSDITKDLATTLKNLRAGITVAGIKSE